MAQQTAPNPRCHRCRIGFFGIGNRSAHRRLADHLKLAHHFKCTRCDLVFISAPHLEFHFKGVHGTPCSTCWSFCEFECAKNFIENVECEDMKQFQADCIRNLEERLIREIGEKSGVNTEINLKFQTTTISLDREENNLDLSEFCNLAYLPGRAEPKLLNNSNRRAVESWVTKEVYLTALEAQIDLANSARIHKFHMVRTCNALFTSIERAEYHRVTKHQVN